ncbi:glycosyltransferase [Saccharothrix sp. BKS2]|uniref:glycosyltransferase n=1 Tax=Saccharothrix sp. BKS2 TaxID=3064400 RepID=UPI0039E7D2D3
MSAGRRVLLVGERDVRHPLAGEEERYLHEVARRWVAEGTRVTWAVGRPAGAPAREAVDGVEVLRSGGPLGPGPLAALRLRWWGPRFDAVVDATTRPAFALPPAAGQTFAAPPAAGSAFRLPLITKPAFAVPLVAKPAFALPLVVRSAFAAPLVVRSAFVVPLVAGRRTPVVRVVHRARSRAGAGTRGRALADALSRRLARWHRDDVATVVPSPSTRHELRRRTGLRGPVFVAPPGTSAGPGERAGDPVVVVVAPLVPEQRLDLLLRRLPGVLARVPGLRVEVIGAGPERTRLLRVAHEEGVARAVVFRGALPDAERRAALGRAWLAVTAADEVSGAAVLEAAAHGVPCVALETVGARDFVRVGEVVRTPDALGPALVRHLAEAADPEHARHVARRCRAWADRFHWERTARLLAAVVEHQVTASRRPGQRRRARSDISALVRLPAGVRPPAGALRVTDEVDETAGVVSALLNGCDDHDALGVLERLGCEGAQVRLAGHDDLLLGPRPAPEPPVPALPRKVDSHVRSC